MGAIKGSLKAKLGGRLAQRMGDFWERSLTSNCRVQRITLVPVPEGAEWRKIKGRLMMMPKKSPFDWVLGFGSKVAFLDTKTRAGKTLPYSDLTPHQIEALASLSNHNQIAGYLVWHRETDEVVFYDVRMLKTLRPRESLSSTQGLVLGCGFRFDLKRLFL